MHASLRDETAAADGDADRRARLEAGGPLAEVAIGDLRLTYRAADGGGRHYHGRGHVEEFHSPLYPLLQAELRPRLCIDVGANYGYTAMLMRRAFPQARLVLVEPVPWLADFVAFNFATNCLRYDALHGAICSDGVPGARTGFGVNEAGTQDSRVIPAGPAWHVVETGVVTLDFLLADAAEGEGVYIKIDTQGWEKSVFSGGERALHRLRRWFARTEFAPAWMESQGAAPASFLADLCRRYAVHEASGRTRWAARRLDDALGRLIEPHEAAAFTGYVRSLDRNDRGWVDLHVQPRAARAPWRRLFGRL